MTKPNMLITGGSGLLGLTWAQLARDSHQVTLGLHKRLLQLPGVKGVQIDLTSRDDFEVLLDRLQIDLVVHCAAMTSVDGCETSPEAARLANVAATTTVAAACAASRVGLIHVSTDHLFAGDRELYSEADIPSPLNVYAATKAAAEEAVLMYHPRALVARTNFYGWGPAYRQSFSDWVLGSLERQQPVHMFTDVRYTPILASVLVEACMDLHAAGAAGIFNVVSDAPLSKYDFGRLLAQRFGLNADLVRPDLFSERATMVARPRNMALANQKLSAVLGREIGTAEQHIDTLFRERDQEWTKQIRGLDG